MDLVWSGLSECGYEVLLKDCQILDGTLLDGMMDGRMVKKSLGWNTVWIIGSGQTRPDQPSFRPRSARNKPGFN
jgi:hypothetical protein